MKIQTSLSLLLLSACVSRQEINAVLFKHEQIPEEICAQNPELKKIGITRTFNCNAELVEAGICAPNQQRVRERIGYCKPQIKSYFGILDRDLEELLKKAGVED
jgi:hypothetical protein